MSPHNSMLFLLRARYMRDPDTSVYIVHRWTRQLLVGAVSVQIGQLPHATQAQVLASMHSQIRQDTGLDWDVPYSLNGPAVGHSVASAAFSACSLDSLKPCQPLSLHSPSIIDPVSRPEPQALTNPEPLRTSPSPN